MADLADQFDQLAGNNPAASQSLADQFDRLASASSPTAKGAKPMASLPMDGTGSFGQNFAAGVGKFFSDTGMGAKQIVNDLAVKLRSATPEGVRNAVDSAGAWMGSQSPEAIQSQGRASIEEARRLDAPLMNTAGGIAGNIFGGIATAPLLPATGTIGGAMAVGAGMGALQPATSWGERAGNALLGGAVGGGTQGVLSGAARILNPKTAPNVSALMSEGITPTPGQILGGGWKRAEEGLTSVPVLGDAIKSAQGRGIEQLNAVAFNRALAPIGEKIPAGTAGRDAVNYVESALGARYDKLLPKLSTQADETFTQDIASLRGMVANGAIDPRVGKSFQRILDADVLSKFQGQGVVTGPTLKNIEGDLGAHIKRLGQSTDADQRLIGDALQETQSALRALVQRSNPQSADELQAINTGWANFKRVQAAASGVGSDTGVFTPAQLQSAVRAKDGSKDKGAFARGNALMQDLSDPAKAVLSPKLPDSGTPYRGMLPAVTAVGGAAATGHPGVASGIALGAMLGPAMYSAPAQKALAALLTKRNAGAQLTAQEIEFLTPLLTGAAGGAAVANVPK